MKADPPDEGANDEATVSGTSQLAAGANTSPPQPSPAGPIPPASIADPVATRSAPVLTAPVPSGAPSIKDNTFLLYWKGYVLCLTVPITRCFFFRHLEAATEAAVTVTVCAAIPASQLGSASGGSCPVVLRPYSDVALRITKGAGRLTRLAGLMRDIGVPDGDRVWMVRHPVLTMPVILHDTGQSAEEALATVAAAMQSPAGLIPQTSRQGPSVRARKPKQKLEPSKSAAGPGTGSGGAGAGTAVSGAAAGAAGAGERGGPAGTGGSASARAQAPVLRPVSGPASAEPRGPTSQDAGGNTVAPSSGVPGVGAAAAVERALEGPALRTLGQKEEQQVQQPESKTAGSGRAGSVADGGSSLSGAKERQDQAVAAPCAVAVSGPTQAAKLEPLAHTGHEPQPANGGEHQPLPAQKHAATCANAEQPVGPGPNTAGAPTAAGAASEPATSAHPPSRSLRDVALPQAASSQPPSGPGPSSSTAHVQPQPHPKAASPQPEPKAPAPTYDSPSLPQQPKQAAANVQPAALPPATSGIHQVRRFTQRQELTRRALSAGGITLRLSGHYGWQQELSRLAPTDGTSAELTLFAEDGDELKAQLLRLPPQRRGTGSFWRLEGLGEWLAQRGARIGHHIEVRLSNLDGRHEVRLLPGAAGGTGSEGDEQGDAEGLSGATGALAEHLAGGHDAGAGSAAAFLVITPRVMADGAFRLPASVMNTIFRDQAEANGPNKDIPVQLLDDRTGTPYDTLIRGYIHQKVHCCAVSWVLKRMRPYIKQHNLQIGDRVGVREGPNGTVGVMFEPCGIPQRGPRGGAGHVDGATSYAAAGEEHEDGAEPMQASPMREQGSRGVSKDGGRPADPLSAGHLALESFFSAHSSPQAVADVAQGQAPALLLAERSPPAQEQPLAPLPDTAPQQPSEEQRKEEGQGEQQPEPVIAEGDGDAGGDLPAAKRARLHPPACDTALPVAAAGVATAASSQQLPPPPASGLPAASITHLHGCVPPSVGLPPLRTGELRLCGLTFHPDIAPAVRRAMDTWAAGLTESLADADPATVQICVLADTAGSQAAWPSYAALVSGHKLSTNVIAARLARHLGLTATDRGWDAPLPEGPMELAEGLEPCGDSERGGAGLEAVAPIRKNSVLGIMGGYVLPEAAGHALVTRGFRDVGQVATAELARRAAPADLASVWQFMAGSFRMPYPWHGLAAEAGVGGGTAGPLQLELSMLGYGNLAALVNDPRLQPRAWADGNDVGDEHGTVAAAANCAVLPVSVRGLVLPVLVATRDIAPGEQLLRDYGPEWWRAVGRTWETLEFDGLAAEKILHPAGLDAGPDSDTEAATDPQVQSSGAPDAPADDLQPRPPRSLQQVQSCLLQRTGSTSTPHGALRTVAECRGRAATPVASSGATSSAACLGAQASASAAVVAPSMAVAPAEDVQEAAGCDGARACSGGRPAAGGAHESTGCRQAGHARGPGGEGVCVREAAAASASAGAGGIVGRKRGAGAEAAPGAKRSRVGEGDVRIGCAGAVRWTDGTGGGFPGAADEGSGGGSGAGSGSESRGDLMDVLASSSGDQPAQNDGRPPSAQMCRQS